MVAAGELGCLSDNLGAILHLSGKFPQLLNYTRAQLWKQISLIYENCNQV